VTLKGKRQPKMAAEILERSKGDMASLLYAITFCVWLMGSPLEVTTSADRVKSSPEPTRDTTMRPTTTASDESEYGSHLDPNGRT
jgi:hypothetical protein